MRVGHSHRLVMNNGRKAFSKRGALRNGEGTQWSYISTLPLELNPDFCAMAPPNLHTASLHQWENLKHRRNGFEMLVAISLAARNTSEETIVIGDGTERVAESVPSAQGKRKCLRPETIKGKYSPGQHEDQRISLFTSHFPCAVKVGSTSGTSDLPLHGSSCLPCRNRKNWFIENTFAQASLKRRGTYDKE